MGLYKGLHVAVVSCQSCILSTSCHNSGVSQLYNAMCSWQVARLFPGIHSHKALREATLNAKLCGRNRCIYYCMYIYIYIVCFIQTFQGGPPWTEPPPSQTQLIDFPVQATLKFASCALTLQLFLAGQEGEFRTQNATKELADL